MVKRMKMKCHSEKKSAFEPTPYEVELRLADPILSRREPVRVVVLSDRPLTQLEVGKLYTLEIKSVE